MNKKEYKNILSQSSWWVINKAVTKSIGIDASLILSDLMSKHEYFLNRGMIDEQGFFFNTRDNIENDTTIPIYRQNKAIEILKQYGLVEITNKGIPPKTRFKLNFKNIDKLIDSLHFTDE